MICQSCNKSPATIHLTEITKGEKREIHLCEHCAKEKGIASKMHFSIADLLGGLIESQGESEPPEYASLVCPACHMTYTDFKAKGRFGCAEDYHVFRKPLLPLLEKIHGSLTHTGKCPSRIGENTAKEQEFVRLQHELNKAVAEEKYERAAELRDTLRKLRESRKNHG
ncbi:MAG: UvrB/UvrC motif-containing protein [Planctomycetota bacterium]